MSEEQNNKQSQLDSLAGDYQAIADRFKEGIRGKVAIVTGGNSGPAWTEGLVLCQSLDVLACATGYAFVQVWDARRPPHCWHVAAVSSWPPETHRRGKSEFCMLFDHKSHNSIFLCGSQTGTWPCRAAEDLANEPTTQAEVEFMHLELTSLKSVMLAEGCLALSVVQYAFNSNS